MKVKLIKKEPERWAKVKFYRNCFHSIGSYWTRSGRRYTGLELEDAERIGKILGQDLRPESDFWDSFVIKIGNEKDTLVFDTENALGELQYRFCKNHKRVAKSVKDINPGTDFVLLEEEREAARSNQDSRVVRKAYSEFDKLTPEQMRKTLRLYGINASNSNNEIVESTLFGLVQEKPEKFIELWVDNDNREAQFFIEEALSKNVLRKSNTTYKYGTDIIGHTLEQAIDYLNNPANRDVKIAILAQIEGKNVLTTKEVKKQEIPEEKPIKKETKKK